MNKKRQRLDLLDPLPRDLQIEVLRMVFHPYWREAYNIVMFELQSTMKGFSFWEWSVYSVGRPTIPFGGLQYDWSAPSHRIEGRMQRNVRFEFIFGFSHSLFRRFQRRLPVILETPPAMVGEEWLLYLRETKTTFELYNVDRPLQRPLWRMQTQWLNKVLTVQDAEEDEKTGLWSQLLTWSDMMEEWSYKIRESVQVIVQKGIRFRFLSTGQDDPEVRLNYEEEVRADIEQLLLILKHYAESARSLGAARRNMTLGFQCLHSMMTLAGDAHSGSSSVGFKYPFILSCVSLPPRLSQVVALLSQNSLLLKS